MVELMNQVTQLGSTYAFAIQWLKTKTGMTLKANVLVILALPDLSYYYGCQSH